MKYAVSQLTFFRVHVKISLAIKNRFRRRQNVYIAVREESQYKRIKKITCLFVLYQRNMIK